MAPAKIKEIMTKEEFELFKDYFHNLTGNLLRESQIKIVSTKLKQRLESLGLNSYKDYYRRLQEDEGERQRFIDLMTVLETSFFRGGVSFKYFSEKIINELKLKSRVKIWSAGCATGQEPYSIAMILKGKVLGKIEILATDINTMALKKARLGVYKESEVKGVPRFFLKYFEKVENYYWVKEEIKKIINFRYHNLLDPIGLTNYFDVIFCRNVLIYFSDEAKIRALNLFWDALISSGYLIISEAETLKGFEPKFEMILPSVYRKKEEKGMIEKLEIPLIE